MNHQLLEEILACPTLPSLPAVAVRVIELTQKKDVKLPELAETIQHDQALAAKVLRTVNSSFYALRRKCTTINQALVMLGLSTVKSLALGFSLVSAVKQGQDTRFDYVAYWRRGLYTAVGAKCVARDAQLPFGDEVFLGGLLQDIGVMALYQTLKDDYIEIMDRTAGDHRQLARVEIEALEIQHPDVGAMMAERWKLPSELVVPVKFHERPTAAPLEYAPRCRCLALGNLLHDIVTVQDPAPLLRRYTALAESWFAIDAQRADAILRAVTDATKEMASLFRLDIGAEPQTERILESADRQLLELARTEPSDPTRSLAALVAGSDHADPLTGALRWEHFVGQGRKAFSGASSQGEPLAVIQVVLEGIDTSSPEAEVHADECSASAVALIRKHIGPLGGLVGRLSFNRFVAIAPGTGQVAAVKAASALRDDLDRIARATPNPRGQRPGFVANIGVAALEPATSRAYPKLDVLIAAADRAADASKQAGGGCVRAFVPKAA